MGLIPKVTCRRCGETFSSMRNRCPNCGTRVVNQSSRTPSTTPGTIRGTEAYNKNEANIKWQLAFGLILVAAVMLSVIVMVTTSLSAEDAVVARATPTPYIPSEVMPTIDPGPTPQPTPEPTVERIIIYSYNNDISTSDKNYKQLRTPSDDDYRMKLSVIVYPQTITNYKVTWTVSDPDCFELIPDENDPNIMWGRILKAKNGGVQITAECLGVTAVTTVWLVSG